MVAQTLLTLAGAGLAALPVLREMGRQPMGPRARRNAPGSFVKLDDGLTHADWLGAASGPVAVCVHGLTTPSVVWLALARELGRLGFRVLVYDLYGRGYSDRPRGLQTPALFCRQLRGLMNHFELHEDVTLVGHSMGGAIAAAFAAEEDHRLRRLVLSAPAGMGHELGTLARWAPEWPLIGDWAFHMGFPRLHAQGCEAERALDSAIEDIADLQLAELAYRGYVRSVLSSLRGTLRHPMEQAHRQIARRRLPVAAIWGAEDRVIPIRAMGTLAQWNRDVRHEVIEGAGHSLPYTHPRAMADAFVRTWTGPVI